MWNLQEFSDTYTRFRESGLTVRDFCLNECINEAKFYYWQKKLKSCQSLISATSGFVPLVIPSGYPLKPVAQHHPPHPVASGESSYEIVYPNGVKLNLPANTDLRLLKSLIFLSE